EAPIAAVERARQDGPDVEAGDQEVRDAVPVRVDHDVELIVRRRAPPVPRVHGEDEEALGRADRDALEADGTQGVRARGRSSAREAPGVEVRDAGDRGRGVRQAYVRSVIGAQLAVQDSLDVRKGPRYEVVGDVQHDAGVRSVGRG